MRLAILAGPHERDQRMHSWTKRASILAAALALTAAGATTAAAWGTDGAGYVESGAGAVVEDANDFEVVHGLTEHVINNPNLELRLVAGDRIADAIIIVDGATGG